MGVRSEEKERTNLACPIVRAEFASVALAGEFSLRVPLSKFLLPSKNYVAVTETVTLFFGSFTRYPKQCDRQWGQMARSGHPALLNDPSM